MSEQHVETTVETVTFFEDRAEVVRVARVVCPAGRSRIVARGVTLLVDDRSLFVRSGAHDSGDADDAGTRVISARVRRISEEKASESAEHAAALETAIRGKAEALQSVASARARAEADARRVAGLLATWSNVAASVPSRAEEAVRELTSSYTSLDAAEKTAFERMSALREEATRLEQDRAHLGARLSQARRITPRYEAVVEIDVECEEAREVSLTIVYRTPCALWRPEHRALLSTNEDGTYALAPAYDLVCTWIYGDKTLTLSVGGGVKDIRRQDWVAFASKHARLLTLEAAAILDEILGCADDALGMIERSPLPEPLRKSYARMLRKRTRGLE